MATQRKTTKVAAPQPLDRHRIRALIEEDNPGAKVNDMETYCHQFLTYVEAAQNILELGTIVAHPRTAAPMDNPYLKVRAAALSAMSKIKRLRKLDRLWLEARTFLDSLESKK
jgi:phage terminase small subunit